jgi:hypothetical protein
MQLVTTVHKSLSDTLSFFQLDTLDFSPHFTAPLYSFSSLSGLLTVSSYNPSARIPRKTPSSLFNNSYLLVRYQVLFSVQKWAIKLTLHKALIRSVMTYASPAWEFAADTHLVKLQRLQNKDLRTTGNFLRHTPVRDLHMTFKIPYLYDYITKLCRQQAEVTRNRDNENVRWGGLFQLT